MSELERNSVNGESLEDILPLLPESLQESLREGKEDVWRRIYIKPRKTLGQHLLRDPSYLKKIVEHANVTPEDVVVELGPGSGTLTRFILEANPRKLYAVEKDYRFYMNLKDRLKGYPNFQPIHGDLRELNLKEIAEREGVNSIKVLGNIPFNLTGFIIRLLIRYLEVVSLASMTFQREVVEKLSARPKEESYSFLSVGVQIFFSVEPKEIIPPKIFIPPPKVYSQIALLKRKDFSSFWTPERREMLFERVRRIFEYGRKKRLIKAMEATGTLGKFSLSKEELSEILGDLRDERVYKIPPESYEKILREIFSRRSSW